MIELTLGSSGSWVQIPLTTWWRQILGIQIWR